MNLGDGVEETDTHPGKNNFERNGGQPTEIEIFHHGRVGGQNVGD